MKKRLLLIGNGMVAGRFLDEWLALAPTDWSITILSAESWGGYNRIQLSPVLASAIQREAIIQKPPDWYEARGISLHQNEAALSIDSDRKTVLTARGRVLGYEHLVIATGSSPAAIPAGNQHLNHIYPFRTLDDTDRLLARARDARTALVVGGGFLGLEAAWGLQQQGLEVTLVHRAAHLLNRQLDAAAGQYLQARLEAEGLRCLTSTEVRRFCGQHSVRGAELRDGRLIDCDMAVIATGITPNTRLARSARLEVGRGILVDAFMRTRQPAISALGECVECQGETFGLVEPLWQQARTLALRLAHADPDRWQPFVSRPVATRLKISGLPLYTAGLTEAKDNMQALVLSDPRAGIYRKLVLDMAGVIRGIVLLGDVRAGQDYLELMLKSQACANPGPALLLGEGVAA